MISGDAAICAKAKAVQEKIETVVSKRGEAAAVVCRHPKVVERDLEEAAKRALSGDLSRYRYALEYRAGGWPHREVYRRQLWRGAPVLPFCAGLGTV